MEPIKCLLRVGRRVAQVARSASGLSAKPQAAAHVDSDAFVQANSQFARGVCPFRSIAFHSSSISQSRAAHFTRTLNELPVASSSTCSLARLVQFFLLLRML